LRRWQINEQRRLRDYEQASRDEDRLFLETAKEVNSEIKEPKNWKKPRDPKKHAGGKKKVAYDFKTMLLILLLVVYHRKRSTGR
jgi:hypothetical protein